MDELARLLQAPFPASEIEWRVGPTNAEKTKGIALAYLTNRAVQNRLDEVCGTLSWRNEFKEWKGMAQLYGISVLSQGEWITKWDGANDSDMEPVKGGLSDSMKRAAAQWGIGRYLYSLESQWVDIKPAGKSYAIVNTPTLPAWALPEAKTGPQTTTPLPATGNNNRSQTAGVPHSQDPAYNNKPTQTSGAINWTAFWAHMREIGADKEFINMNAAIHFKLSGPIDSLKGLIKSQTTLNQLDQFIVDAVFIRDNSERLPGED